TGMGSRLEKPVKVVKNTVQGSANQAAAPAQREKQPVNYRALYRPTVMRNQSHNSAAAAANLNPQDDLDYMDIPAFPRRQSA
ncbi:cell division protein FtsZ, partial [Pseudomonas aeruginosa]